VRSQAPRGFALITKSAPTPPRTTSSAPTRASIGPTHGYGTREIASITTPSSTSETARTRFSARERNFAGLYSPRAPHRTKITLTAAQPKDRRSKKMCPVTPSHTTRAPKKRNNNSTITRSNRSPESILSTQFAADKKRRSLEARKSTRATPKCFFSCFPYFTSLLPLPTSRCAPY
jgi:hypothetical protein